jgi:hypothetical protein
MTPRHLARHQASRQTPSGPTSRQAAPVTLAVTADGAGAGELPADVEPDIGTDAEADTATDAETATGAEV